MKHKTMREPSARLLATLHRDNKEFFILSEAVKILSASNPDAVRKLISNMVKRGLLFRIKDGLYSIIPHDKDA
ncbi:MAG: transcriptional regulator, partial [Candidatus Nephrothrix sp. EaCA]